MAGCLDRAGYRQLPHGAFDEQAGGSEPVYSRDYPLGRNIYRRNRKVDFILYYPERFRERLVVEAKWQQKSGTAEQKLPFLVLTIQKSQVPTAVVLGGKGFSQGAIDWLGSQAGTGCLERVLTLEEFPEYIGADEG